MSATIRSVCAVALVALLASLVTAGCGGTSPSPSPSTADSGVKGKALIVGGPPPGGPRPMSGVTVAVHRGKLGGPIVAKRRAAFDGSFTFDLPPGTYTLVEVSDAAVAQTVVVRPGQRATVRLLVQAM